MALLSVSVDVSAARAGLKSLRAEQLPFTLAVTLTRLAQQGQESGRQLEAQVFRLTNSWTQQNTKITPATKQRLVSEVWTDTSNWRTGAPDYLPLQESGGEKVHHEGRTHFALPTRYLRQMCPGPIPAELRPKALLGYAQLHGRYEVRRGERSRLRTAQTVRGFVFFLQTLKSGEPAILGRYITERDAYPFYLLIPEARLRARFPLDQIVEQTVNDNAEAIFRKAAIETMSNDLLRDAGWRVEY